MRQDRRSLLRIARTLVSLALLGALLGCVESGTRDQSSTSGEDDVRGAPPADTADASALPKFEWPPPTASARVIIPPAQLLHAWQGPANTASATAPRASIGRYSYESLASRWSRSGPTWMHVDAALTEALMEAGYSESSYFAIPRGFALVTRLEQINPDGTPLPEGNRWQQTLAPRSGFSLKSYVQALFRAPMGHYRIIVFVVTPEPFIASRTAVTESDAKAWLDTGANVLPRELGELPLAPDAVCTALIYEFARSDVDSQATTLVPGTISGVVHLQASGIQKGLP